MEDFKKIIENFESLMKKIKNECANLDKAKGKDSDKETIHYLQEKYVAKMDGFFDDIWENSGYETDEYKEKAEYLIKELDPFFVDDIETVSYIRQRPLGYAGDFVTMNFIYDFNENAFLGKNYYQKFINNYTCTIKVSNSNIGRKQVIKEQLTEKINTSSNGQKILSLGSGPAREIIELIKEEKLLKPAEFYCLDFEDRAIQFAKDQLAEMDYDTSKIKINFIHENLLKIIKKEKMILPKKSLDFVYISGVFDYFSPKVCQRMILNTLPLVKPTDKSKLLFFNLSSEEEKHRGYYEMLAKWEMIHRTSSELAEWEKEIKGYKFNFKKEDDCPSYHIVEIK